MRTVVAWQETPPEKEGVRNVCYDVAFKPDGTQLVAGVGSRVLIYDAADGDLLHALKGHKDSVYCVAYAFNGKRFASGGADKTVIIWTSKAEGILKYTHNDSIQCLAYNPVSQQLASATASDFGLWSPEAKSVSKHKVPAKALCMAWTADGMYLAIGCFDGSITIRDKAGSEKGRIDTGVSPVWSMAWNPQDQNVLAVGLLDGLLRFYTPSGAQKYKERRLVHMDAANSAAGGRTSGGGARNSTGGAAAGGPDAVKNGGPGTNGWCDPLSIAYFNGEYLLVGGTDKSVHLYTKEGIFLTTVATRSTWAWCVRPRPKANYVAVGCEDGSIAMLQLVFSTVHGLYHERYAYRELMTDVIVQHLVTEQKVRIKCRDYVKKIAVYKDRLAVQLPNKVVLYELAGGESSEQENGAAGAVDEYDMQYRSATKINQRLDCNLLVVTSHHIILCQEKRLQLYNFDGVREREWHLDSVIRYIKVAGGPPRREGLLVGLKSGAVFKVFLDNPFPVPLLQHSASIRCLDLSSARSKLALVDETSRVMVYDLATKEMLFEEKNANSVAWNTDHEESLCFSGGGQLSIKTADFPLQTQKLNGFVVGFKGSKVFCLQYASMQTVDVPQGTSMQRFLDRKDFAGAYRLACLGVTDADWLALAQAALQAMQLDVARKAFIRIRDVRAVELVNRVEVGLRGGQAQPLLMGEVAAWQGDYQEAAKLFVQAGALDNVMEMWTDLRQFDEAKRWAEEFARQRGDSAGVQELMGRQAAWSEETANYEAAAEMYIKAKRYDRAVALLARNAWWPRLLGLVRQLDKSVPEHVKLLGSCAGHFRRAGEYGAAKETLLRLEDMQGLVSLYVEECKWDDALLMLEGHPELKPAVYLPYAKWLSDRDRFDDARRALREGGQPELGAAMLKQLVAAAVREGRFADAAHLSYQLATEALQDIANPPALMTSSDRSSLQRFTELYNCAELYAAYETVQSQCSRPFKTSDDSTLFNAARFMLMRSMSRGAEAGASSAAGAGSGGAPAGVSIGVALLVLARQAVKVGAYKLARFAYGKLQTLVLPPAWREEVELQSVLIRAQPFSDAEALLPVCYRCQATNPLLNTQGDYCVNCGAPFIRSFVTFEALPLVEFEIEAGISEQEAESLLGEDAGASSSGALSNTGNARTSMLDTGGANVLRLEDDTADPYANALGGGGGGDAFAAQMTVPHTPIRLDRAALRKLRPSEVLVRRWPNPHIPAQYFRLMDEEAAVAVGPCGHFFEADEYEMALLEHGHAPFSRDVGHRDQNTSEGGAGA